MKVLLLTEKTSQQGAIGNVFSLRNHSPRAKVGSFRGDEVVVFPFSGHILGAFPLTPRDAEIESLPNLPPPNKFMKRGLIPIDEKYDNKETIKNKKRVHKIYNDFKKLVSTYDFDRIIIATDPDYEGCAIAREMLEEFSLMSKNICFMNISNISPNKLKEELNLAWDGKDAIDWIRWADIAYLRNEISNCIGIDVSQLLMKKTGSFTTFGTQQTRVVRLVVNRTKEHEAFDTSSYYRVRIKTDVGDFILKLDDENMGKDKEYVNQILSSVSNERYLTVEDFTLKKAKIISPKWYDGSNIATLASKSLGKPIKEIFSKSGGLLQKMYEQGKMTYPRGDAKGKMPTSQFDDQVEIALSLAEHYGAKDLDTTLRKKHLWRDDSSAGKGEIINHTPCTIATPTLSLSSLSREEREIVDISAKMLLACFSPDGEAYNFTIKSILNGVSFEHKSSKDTVMGWRNIYGKEERTSLVDEATQKGSTIKIQGMSLEEYKKDPPPLFTESSLLAEIKRKKIGADSTFSTHISNFLDPRRNYGEVKGKHIHPTKKAFTLIDLIPKKSIDIMSIFEEDVFEDLLTGKMTIEQAQLGRLRIIEKVFHQIKEAIEDKPKMVESLRVESGDASITVGICPLCGSEVLDKGGISSQYVCQKSKLKKTDSGWENIGSCTFRQSKHINNKGVEYKINIPTMKALLLGDLASTEVHYKASDKKTITKLKLDIDAENNPSIDFIFNN